MPTDWVDDLTWEEISGAVSSQGPDLTGNTYNPEQERDDKGRWTASGAARLIQKHIDTGKVAPEHVKELVDHLTGMDMKELRRLATERAGGVKGRSKEELGKKIAEHCLNVARGKTEPARSQGQSANRHKEAHDALVRILGDVKDLDFNDDKAVRTALDRALTSKPAKGSKEPKPVVEVSEGIHEKAREINRLKDLANVEGTTSEHLQSKLDDMELHKMTVPHLKQLGKAINADTTGQPRKRDLIDTIHRTVHLVHQTFVGAAT